MQIRKTEKKDLEEVMEIYRGAQEFMIKTGNPEQWGRTYPSRELVLEDIEKGKSYVCYLEGRILAVFYYDICDEADYRNIDGAWLNDREYGVVHRIAAREGSGGGRVCIAWCYEQCKNLRLDTHEDNLPMQRLLKNQGFTRCGKVTLEKYGERIAFHKTAFNC